MDLKEKLKEFGIDKESAILSKKISLFFSNSSLDDKKREELIEIFKDIFEYGKQQKNSL